MIVNLIIMLLIIGAAYFGYRRGFLMIAADLVGFIASALAAAIVYRRVGRWLVAWTGIVPSFGDVLAYLLLFGLGQLVYSLFMRETLVRLPKHWFKASINRWLGSLAGVFRALFLTALFLVVFAGLPLSSAQKQPITDPAMPRALLALSGGLQRHVNGILGTSLTDTLNFLTIRTTSTESVNLGFTTTRVKVDSRLEEAMLRLVNQERTSRGLKPLVMNQAAREVARAHSRDMFARGYFAHVNPDGLDPFDRMDAGGVRYLTAGENLAYAPTLQLAHEGLMNSPGHRENILRPQFGAVGIGVVDGGLYGVMFTQNFTD